MLASPGTALLTDPPGDMALAASIATGRAAARQKRTDLSACLQSDQMDIGDPLPMPQESVKVDGGSVAVDARGADTDSSSLGLSQVLGKILQQLSISAWVPAAMLVGNGAVLLQLRADRDYNIARAVKELAGKPLGTLIILGFALILATVVTQAFEFEVIRFLEGYFNSSNRFIHTVMAWRIQRHESKRARLAQMLVAARINARGQAAARMANLTGYESHSNLLEYMKQKLSEGDTGFDAALHRKAEALKWRLHASSAARYRIDSINARLASYPTVNRVLPTRLGNVLRATEGKIKLGENENLAGYVVRHHEELPASLQSEHKDYRTRLDMYCSLTLAFAILAAISIAALYNASPLWGMAIAVVIYALMGFLSYEAAIASARSYGLILLEIQQHLARQEKQDKTSELSAGEGLRSLFHLKTVQRAHRRWQRIRLDGLRTVILHAVKFLGTVLLQSRDPLGHHAASVIRVNTAVNPRLAPRSVTACR